MERGLSERRLRRLPDRPSGPPRRDPRNPGRLLPSQGSPGTKRAARPQTQDEVMTRSVQLLNEYRDLLKEAAAMQLGTPGTGPRRSTLLNFKNIFRRRGVPRWYPSHSLDLQIEACPS